MAVITPTLNKWSTPQWEVQLQEATQTYFIKNQGTGLYLGGDGQNAYGRGEHPAGVHFPVGWDIRQAEFSEQYAYVLSKCYDQSQYLCWPCACSIYLPGTSYAVDYSASVGLDASQPVRARMQTGLTRILTGASIY